MTAPLPWDVFEHHLLKFLRGESRRRGRDEVEWMRLWSECVAQPRYQRLLIRAAADVLAAHGVSLDQRDDLADRAMLLLARRLRGADRRPIAASITSVEAIILEDCRRALELGGRRPKGFVARQRRYLHVRSVLDALEEPYRTFLALFAGRRGKDEAARLRVSSKSAGRWIRRGLRILKKLLARLR